MRVLAVGQAVERVEEQAAEVLSDYFSAATLEAVQDTYWAMTAKLVAAVAESRQQVVFVINLGTSH